jgi:hypothetical protein
VSPISDVTLNFDARLKASTQLYLQIMELKSKTIKRLSLLKMLPNWQLFTEIKKRSKLRFLEKVISLFL